ncbi:hypothetical protein D9758_015665 [Tetrapyrgos nigripes]|uniref:Uncharacterized protein n=1 Tax=Tetrapyrgos nigripes TaxID=182062 RepID=A0A8H5FH80_9AGAR|nr:hypothetical protein D9758_015665 [Tetrapyrgos nigripes]
MGNMSGLLVLRQSSSVSDVHTLKDSLSSVGMHTIDSERQILSGIVHDTENMFQIITRDDRDKVALPKISQLQKSERTLPSFNRFPDNMLQ